jgi:hypothetical protein
MSDEEVRRKNRRLLIGLLTFALGLGILSLARILLKG